MVERLIERLIAASRWLMVPFYLGLIAALAMLAVEFVQELAHLAPRVLVLSTSDVLLAVLSLVDLTLAASLVLMIVVSGYENFVSRAEGADATNHRQTWMGQLDFGGQKLKLISSVVAISAIDLLKRFMNVGETSPDEVARLIALHLTFVVTGVMLALTDFVAARGKPAAKV